MNVLGCVLLVANYTESDCVTQIVELIRQKSGVRRGQGVCLSHFYTEGDSIRRRGMKQKADPESRVGSARWWMATVLAHEEHFFNGSVLPRLQSIEVDTAREVACIEYDPLIARTLSLAHQRSHFLTEHTEYFQLHSGFF